MKQLNECRILIVDDTKANIDILVEGLKNDYKLSVALNGAAALQIAAKTPLDLVLLDIMMPGMDGFEVCQRLRQMPELADMGIIFLSALDEMKDKARGFELGANDYITKPFDIMEVRVRVRSLLRAKMYSDAVKEQLAGELRVARTIQEGMIPREFAAVEKEFGVEIDATLIPAREVGGDLYALVPAGGGRLVALMGDVSGKSIPAALFMVRAATVARLLAKELASPDRILTRLNDELAADNPYGMFVTMACIVFEPALGKLSISNGGHTPPVLLRPGEKPRWLVEDFGTALGLEGDMPYNSVELEFKKDDVIVLYTDGVTEAFNKEAKLYGSDRLLADLADPKCKDFRSLIPHLVECVNRYADGAAQSDDIAVMAIRSVVVSTSVGASKVVLNLALPATSANVMVAVEQTQQCCKDVGVPESMVFGLCLALEECASNVVNHAYCGDCSKLFRVVVTHESNVLAIELRDQGPPFDPLCADCRPIDEDPDRPVGGWGIHLVRHYMDDVTYQRDGNENVLKLFKNLVVQEQPPCPQ